MFTRSHFSLKLPTYVERILTKQLHDLIVTKLCQTPRDRLYIVFQYNLKAFLDFMQCARTYDGFARKFATLVMFPYLPEPLNSKIVRA